MATDNQALIARGTEIAGFDPRKFSKRTIRILLYGGIAAFILFNWHENIVSMMEDSVEMMKLGLYALVLFGIYAFIWKWAGTFSDYISKITLSWLIDYDPWVLQYKEIDKAEEDWNETIKGETKINGEWIKNKGKLKQAETDQKQAKEAEILLVQELKRTDLTPESRTLKTQMLEDERQKQVDNLNYIQSIAPLTGDMEKILEIIKMGKIVMKHKTERLRRSLAQLKDTYDSSLAGMQALTAMQNALAGRGQIHDLAELSKMKVLQDITMNIGAIRTSSDIIGEIVANNNLQDKAKMNAAYKDLAALGITSDLSVPGAIPIDYYQNTSVNFQNVLTSADTRFGQMPD